jgi:hypothetical protein
MRPELSVSMSALIQGAIYIAATGAVGLIAWFAQRNLARIETDVSLKADKEHMEKEIEALREDLRESRAAHALADARIERANSEKLAELTSDMRDRMGSMERNMDARIVAMRDDMTSRLDMILQVLDRRK